MKFADKLRGNKNINFILLACVVVLTAGFIAHAVYSNMRFEKIEKQVSSIDTKLWRVERTVRDTERELDNLEDDIRDIKERLRL